MLLSPVCIHRTAVPERGARRWDEKTRTGDSQGYPERSAEVSENGWTSFKRAAHCNQIGNTWWIFWGRPFLAREAVVSWARCKAERERGGGHDDYRWERRRRGRRGSLSGGVGRDGVWRIAAVNDLQFYFLPRWNSHLPGVCQAYAI